MGRLMQATQIYDSILPELSNDEEGQHWLTHFAARTAIQNIQQNITLLLEIPSLLILAAFFICDKGLGRA